MSTILGLVIAISQFLGLIAVGAVIGLWWTPAFDRGNHNAELMRATFFLFLFSIYFYKAVIKRKNHISKFLLMLYSALATFTVCSYIFGFFIK